MSTRTLETLPPQARQLVGPAIAVLAIVVLELMRRPQGLEPATMVPIAVVAATIVGGLLGGALTAAVGSVYSIFYYAQSGPAALAGGGTRVVITVLGSALAIWLVRVLLDKGKQQLRNAARQRGLADRIQQFTNRLGNEPEESLSEAMVRGASDLLEADMAVLTLLDPQSGRHFVKAVHGGVASAMGIEVIPGVGVTGQALRERRIVVAASHVPAVRNGGTPVAGGPPRVVATVPAVQHGRVLATLTVGRADPGRPFDDEDMTVLEHMTPVITLAVSGQLQLLEHEQGSPRDAVTGLYSRPYLDAGLEQLLALRRRMAPDERPPLSMIMFDIDGFKLLNERHGRQSGDAILRAVGALIRKRFRASDILARVGPDSFLVVLNGAAADLAAEAAALIRRQVRELTLTNPNGDPFVVSISAGCALFRDGDPPEALFKSVEAALETARWSGPGAVVSI